MRVRVIAHPRSRAERVEVRDGVYHVFVKEVPADGRANKAVLRVLAAFFPVSQASVVLLRGGSSKIKMVDVLGLQEPR